MDWDAELFVGLNKCQKDAHSLHYIDGGYMCYDEFDIGNISNMAKRAFNFGCFNHSRKLSSDTIKIFAKILRKCENSKLILKSISFKNEAEIQRVVQKFRNEGILKDRLNILEATDTRESHIEKYNHIDIALDPMPYGGATTTCESLSMVFL